jgi:hypothetical protein
MTYKLTGLLVSLIFNVIKYDDPFSSKGFPPPQKKEEKGFKRSKLQIFPS